MALTDNAVAFWDLDADVLDDSGNGKNGTNNGVTFAGGKGNFNGSSDIAVPGSLLAANTYTLSLWFNPSSLPSYAALVSYYGGDTDAIECFTTTEGGSGSGWLPNYGVTTRIPSGTFSTGTLYHVAASMNAGTVKVYVNNSLKYTSTGGYTSFSTAGKIGSRGGSFGFSGTVQSVGLFSDAKDATWVSSMYNSGTPLTWAGMSGGGGHLFRMAAAPDGIGAGGPFFRNPLAFARTRRGHRPRPALAF